MHDTTSSTVSNGKCCLFTALFKSHGSIQTLMEPLGLVTTTMLLTQLVGFFTFFMIPSLTMRYSSFFTLSLMEIGNRLGGCTTGVTVESI